MIPSTFCIKRESSLKGSYMMQMSFTRWHSIFKGESLLMLNFIYFRIKEFSFKDMQCNNNTHLNVKIYEGKSPKPLLLFLFSSFFFEMSNCHQQQHWHWHLLVLRLRHTFILMLIHQNTTLKITLQIDYYYFFQHWTRSIRQI